jgi:hypothetical protein
MNDTAVINNIYGILEGLILFFKILMGTRKDFFEIYRPFGHASSKRFASPARDSYFTVWRIQSLANYFTIWCI